MGGPPLTYAYDAENHLVAADGVAYTYDGDGERVEKSSGEMYWYTSGGEVLDETDLSGNLTSEYIFFGGARIARRDGSGNIFYYLADHLGSSREIIEAGQTTACYDADFYPFGGERAYVNNCPQNYKFTGKERDPESGLDDFSARFYGSWTGRFTSPDDPFVGWNLADPQSLNLYAYVQDNPINDVDPTGHCDIRDGANLIGCTFNSEESAIGEGLSLEGLDNPSGRGDFPKGPDNEGMKANNTIQAGAQKNDTQTAAKHNDAQAKCPSGVICVTSWHQYPADPPYNRAAGVLPSSSASPRRPTRVATAGAGAAAVGELACVVLEPCGAGEVAGAALLGGGFLAVEAGMQALHSHFSKGREQRTIEEVAREKGVDARQLGDAVEEAKHGSGRRGDDNLSLDDIREIADEMKGGGWWGGKGSGGASGSW